jgi:hypothetical protein
MEVIDPQDVLVEGWAAFLNELSKKIEPSNLAELKASHRISDRLDRTMQRRDLYKRSEQTRSLQRSTRRESMVRHSIR